MPMGHRHKGPLWGLATAGCLFIMCSASDMDVEEDGLPAYSPQWLQNDATHTHDGSSSSSTSDVSGSHLLNLLNPQTDFPDDDEDTELTEEEKIKTRISGKAPQGPLSVDLNPHTNTYLEDVMPKPEALDFGWITYSVDKPNIFSDSWRGKAVQTATVTVGKLLPLKLWYYGSLVKHNYYLLALKFDWIKQVWTDLKLKRVAENIKKFSSLDDPELMRFKASLTTNSLMVQFLANVADLSLVEALWRRLLYGIMPLNRVSNLIYIHNLALSGQQPVRIWGHNMREFQNTMKAHPPSNYVQKLATTWLKSIIVCKYNAAYLRATMSQLHFYALCYEWSVTIPTAFKKFYARAQHRIASNRAILYSLNQVTVESADDHSSAGDQIDEIENLLESDLEATPHQQISGVSPPSRNAELSFLETASSVAAPLPASTFASPPFAYLGLHPRKAMLLMPLLDRGQVPLTDSMPLQREEAAAQAKHTRTLAGEFKRDLNSVAESKNQVDWLWLTVFKMRELRVNAMLWFNMDLAYKLQSKLDAAGGKEPDAEVGAAMATQRYMAGTQTTLLMLALQRVNWNFYLVKKVRDADAVKETALRTHDLALQSRWSSDFFPDVAKATTQSYVFDAAIQAYRVWTLSAALQRFVSAYTGMLRNGEGQELWKECGCESNMGLLPHSRAPEPLFGMSCEAWNQFDENCLSQNSGEFEGEAATMCHSSWCYVRPSCPTSSPSILHPGSGLFVSYAQCVSLETSVDGSSEEGLLMALESMDHD